MTKIDPSLEDEIYRPGRDGLVEEFEWTPEKLKAPGTENEAQEIDI